ncbi:LysR family transcriptional regulator [Thioclava sp. FR2]|uniref:LysR family transcriptional regulator n=1 Tax=Thioclava sp. FR2 TaxID=3445780 RepID=UPI003EB86B05
MYGKLGEAVIGLNGLKLCHVRQLAEIRTTGRLGPAAEKIGVAQPAASRMMSEMWVIIGHPIHEREGRTLKLTVAGVVLARRASRIQHELHDAGLEVAEAVSGTFGHVGVGSVTGPSLSHVLPVLRKLREDRPGITVEVVVATSDDLCRQILEGEFDFALGASLQVCMTRWFSAGLEESRWNRLSAAITRFWQRLRKGRRSYALRLGYVGRPDALGTDRAPLVCQCGPPVDRQWVSTSSFLFTLALLKETDAIAPLASSVVDSLLAAKTCLLRRCLSP